MRPLADTTIVEATDAASAPVRLAIGLAGRIAADLGAQVIRLVSSDVELAEIDADAATFLEAGKQRIVLPTDTAAGRQKLSDFKTGKTIVIGGEASDSLKLATGLPLPTVTIADWPEGLPPRPITEHTALAASGMLHMIGAPDREPLRLGGHLAAYPAGLAAFSAIMAQRAALDGGGLPAPARVSIVETLLWVNWKAVCGAEAEGVSPVRLGENSEYQVMPCRDGWVAVVFTVTQFGALQALVGDPALADSRFATRKQRAQHIGEFNAIIARWCRDRSRAEIYAAAQALGVPIGPVLTPAELLHDPQYQARDFLGPAPGGGRMPRLPVIWNGRRLAADKSVDQATGATGGPATPSIQARAQPQNAGPLAGVRVVDFGQLTAGANTSAMLADLGAEVIKIESAGYLDLFRTIGKPDDDPGWWNRSPQFRFTNRNKLGLSLDLKQAEGRQIAAELIRKSDVVVENFRRGVLERLGFDFESLRKINPRIVLASISSQGESGPNRLHASFGSTLDATAGLAAITGYPGGKPLISGMDVNYPDQVVSLLACGMVIAALREARTTGAGVHLDLAQREIASFLIGGEILAASRGAAAPPLRNGNSEPGQLLQDCFKCADERWLAVSVRDDAAARAVLALTGADCSLRASLARWCSQRTVNSADDALARLTAQTGGLAVMPVLDGLDLLTRPELAGASLVRGGDGGLVKGVPYTFGGQGLNLSREAPDLGQHTDTILRDILGLDPANIERLAASGLTRSDL